MNFTVHIRQNKSWFNVPVGILKEFLINSAIICQILAREIKQQQTGTISTNYFKFTIRILQKFKAEKQMTVAIVLIDKSMLQFFFPIDMNYFNFLLHYQISSLWRNINENCGLSFIQNTVFEIFLQKNITLIQWLMGLTIP